MAILLPNRPCFVPILRVLVCVMGPDEYGLYTRIRQALKVKKEHTSRENVNVGVEKQPDVATWISATPS